MASHTLRASASERPCSRKKSNAAAAPSISKRWSALRNFWVSPKWWTCHRRTPPPGRPGCHAPPTSASPRGRRVGSGGTANPPRGDRWSPRAPAPSQHGRARCRGSGYLQWSRSRDVSYSTLRTPSVTPLRRDRHHRAGNRSLSWGAEVIDKMAVSQWDRREQAVSKRVSRTRLVNHMRVHAHSGPVRIDVKSDAPGMVGGPDKGQLVRMEPGLPRRHSGFAPVVCIGQRATGRKVRLGAERRPAAIATSSGPARDPVRVVRVTSCSVVQCYPDPGICRPGRQDTAPLFSSLSSPYPSQTQK